VDAGVPNYRRRRQVAGLIALALASVVVGTVTCSVSPRGAKTASGAPARAAPAPGAALNRNIYAATAAGNLSPVVDGVPYRVYVPNSEADTVDVIDPATLKVVAHYRVGHNPQHVVPAWDLRTLYVANDLSNSLTPIDPRTGHPSGPDIPVDDPYNMYFTPDGRDAIVVAEARGHLDFRDPHDFRLHKRLPVACKGVDHIDFSAAGDYLIASCEFSGQLVKVDLKRQEVLGYLTTGGMPQDVKVDPAGKIFYVADMVAGGLHEIDGDSFTEVGFLPTGPETHGLYPSRDAHVMYVSNRGGLARHGSISVVDFTTRTVVATWLLPGKTTPDMGGVSPDGRTLWLAGRRNRKVYVIDTTDGRLLAQIPVGAGPHGLCVWPQPGRYSLGHTGILR
jgi:YVTN family beta-propeller protein